MSGTFEVKGHGFNEFGGPFFGDLNGYGTGDLEGMKLRASFERGAARRTFVIKGYLLDP